MFMTLHNLSDEALVKIAGESYDQGRPVDDEILHEIFRRAFHATPISSLVFACADRLMRSQYERKIRASEAFAVLADRQGSTSTADIIQAGYTNALKAMQKCPDFFVKFPTPYYFVAYLNKCFLSVMLEQVDDALNYSPSEISEEIPDKVGVLAELNSELPVQTGEIFDIWEHLQAILRADLTLKQWELFMLRYQDGIPPRQIAEETSEFGPNAGAVSSELYRILKIVRNNQKVRELAEVYGIDLGDDAQ
jgi:hypothetical protein